MLKSTAIFVLSLVFFNFSYAQEKINEQVLPASLEGISYVSENEGGFVLVSITVLKGALDKGKTLSFGEQKLYNVYNEPLPSFSNFAPYIEAVFFDGDFNIVEKKSLLVKPINGKEEHTYLKIPEGVKTGYPENLEFNSSIEDLKELKWLPKELSYMIYADRGTFDSDIYQVDRYFDYNEKGQLSYLNHFDNLELDLGEFDKKFQTALGSSHLTTDGSILKTGYIKQNGKFVQNHYGVASISPEGDFRGIEVINSEYGMSEPKSIAVYDEEGKDKGVLYFAHANKLAAKKVRNPKANEFFLIYFDENGKMVFKNSFFHGEESKSNGFLPIFIVKKDNGLLVANANNFGLSKKKGFYERIGIDLNGKITSIEKYEGELYNSNFDNRADFLDLDEVLRIDDSFYNFIIRRSEAVGSAPITTFGLELTEITSDLAFKSRETTIEHRPTRELGYLNIINAKSQDYIVYSNSEIGMNWIMSKSNLTKKFQMTHPKGDFSLLESGANFIHDKKKDVLYFFYPEGKNTKMVTVSL